MARHLRTVIRHQLFEDSLHTLIPDPIAADEFIQGVIYLLASDPEAGIQEAGGSPVWAVPVASDDMKQLTLYYTFDDSEVLLLYILAS